MIVSDRDTDDMLDSTDCGESGHLGDAPSPSNTQPLESGHPRHAILNKVDGCPKKGVDNKPIHMKGKTDKELKGVSFLHGHDDGTQECATIVEPRPERLKGDKDCDQFVIKHDRSQVEDVMACNDIMNCLH